MTTSHFGSIKVSVPYKNTLYVGTTNGITRIDESINLSTTILSENSGQTGTKIIQGTTDTILGVKAGNEVAVTTQDGLSYLSYEDEFLAGNSLGGFLVKSYVKDSNGIVVNSGTEISILTQDIGIFVRSIAVINDDDVVDFGEDGTLATLSLPDSQVGVVSAASEIPIYNDSDYAATAKVLIAFTGNEEDSYLEISDSPLGPFYGIRENGFSFPSNIPWENGLFTNTQVTDNYVTTSGVEGPFIYVSPVIDTYDYSTLRNLRVYWQLEDSYPGTIDYTPVVDGAYTVRVRQSMTAPSGTWSSGNAPDDVDSLWGLSGSLEYQRVPNYSIDRYNSRYVQFEVTLNPYFNTGFAFGTTNYGAEHYVTSSGNPGAVPKLYELGLEIPILVENIQPQDYKPVYVRSNIPVPASGTRIRNTLRKSYLDVWWELPDGY